MRNLLPAACAELARSVQAAQAVLGTIRRERLFKLLRFLRLIVGTTEQRCMIVLSWFLGAAKNVVKATGINFRTSLLIQAVSGALVAHRNALSAAKAVALRALAAAQIKSVLAVAG